MLLYDHDRAIARWAADQLEVQNWVGLTAGIGVIRNGAIVAGAVFYNHRPPDIEIAFVTTTRHWATPQVVRGILRYPFMQLGCKRLTALTEVTNQPTRAFLCRLGFREEGRHPDAFMSGDGLSYGLLRKDAARWLAEEKTCQEQIAA